MLRMLFAGALALAAMPATAAEWSKLIEPADITAQQADGAVVIDIRIPPEFAKGHVPGAVNLPYPAWRGPKENPGALVPDAQVTRLLNYAGIEPETPVIVINPGDSPSAFGATARVYWTLKSAGLERIAIANGGYKAWAAAGLPLSTETAPRQPSTVSFTLSDEWAVTREEVEAVTAGESDMLLIDARPDDFFRAKTKHRAARWAGTLEGAVNIVHESFFGQDGRIRQDPEAVRAHAEKAGWTPGTTVVSFCNTGHWAASNWFALSEIGGIEDVRLYPESMVGWTSFFSG